MDLETARVLLEQWGYLIIVGWTFLEGETIVIVAGLMASLGYLTLHPGLIALCAFIGSFCSDQLMFTLGKHKGPWVLRKFPRLDSNTERARRLILKYETALILGFRFVYGVRNVTPILLGISGVSHFKFFCLNAVGAAIWALCFSFGGYYCGGLIIRLSNEHPHAKHYFLGGLLIILAAAFIVQRLRNKKTVRHAIEVAHIPPEKIPGKKKTYHSRLEHFNSDKLKYKLLQARRVFKIKKR
ncbi:MAG: DedA family protein [Deltaproteobacteria bacterium]|jgi:membrane protein DedA with SNARE-associated domain|nr:DedA family protein [Deltaproteobacteria bacterium]